MSTSAVFSSIPKIGELAKKYPTLSEMAIIGTINTATQLSSKDHYLYTSLLEAELSYLLTRKNSASVAWSKNMMLGTYMAQAEQQEKETRFGIKEDPEYFKKGVSVSIGAIGSKKIDNIFQNHQNPYVKNIIKPTVNSIFSEGISTGIDKTEEFMNKAMESK